MRTLALSLLLLAPLPAAAAEFDFDDLVEDVERHLDAHRVKIPLWGLIRVATWPAYRPFGVSSFNLAVFEDVRRSRGGEPESLRRLGPSWRPVLRIRERHGDQVYMYARDEGSWVRMIVLTVDHDDAVLVQFKLRPSALLLYVSKAARGDHHGTRFALPDVEHRSKPRRSHPRPVTPEQDGHAERELDGQLD